MLKSSGKGTIVKNEDLGQETALAVYLEPSSGSNAVAIRTVALTLFAKLAVAIYEAAMSDLQRAWAKSKLGLVHEPFIELEEDEQHAEQVSELPEHLDDDSSPASSASSVSSTGTIIPTPTQRLFARPQGYSCPSASHV